MVAWLGLCVKDKIAVLINTGSLFSLMDSKIAIRSRTEQHSRKNTKNVIYPHVQETLPIQLVILIFSVQHD